MNFINIFSLRERAREFGVAICTTGTAALRSLCADLREIEVPGNFSLVFLPSHFFSLSLSSSLFLSFLDRSTPARVEYGI